MLGRRSFCTSGAALVFSTVCSARPAPVTICPSGGSDDQRAIATAFSSGANVVLAPGKYMIDAPIEVPPHCRLSGHGAQVYASISVKGRLLSHGTHVELGDGSELADLFFGPQPDMSGFVPRTTASVIMLRGSYGLVSKVTVHAVPPANPRIELQGLIVAGVGNRGNRVEHCIFRRCGVHYSYGAAIGTQVISCTIDHAPSNALTGLCTVPNAIATGHILMNNRIIFPGRMGIEDFARLLDKVPKIIRGTRILQNFIVSDALARPEYFAISAVGLDSVIEGNRVINWPRQYAIEVGGGRGALIRGNLLRWTDGNPHEVVGVQVQAPAFAAARRVQVVGNQIEGAAVAMLSRSQDVLFAHNIVIDPSRSVADYDVGSAAAEIVGNVVEVRRRSTTGVGARILFNMLGCAEFRGNQIRYAANALDPQMRDITIITGGDRSRFVDNSIEVTGAVRRGTSVIGITTNGMRPRGISMAGMITDGPVIGDYSNMVAPSEPRANRWAGGLRGRH